jgi:hypothetical protein
MCRKPTAANDVNTAEISNLFAYKNTNLRRVLKKYTQARENGGTDAQMVGGSEVKTNIKSTAAHNTEQFYYRLGIKRRAYQYIHPSLIRQMNECT